MKNCLQMKRKILFKFWYFSFLLIIVPLFGWQPASSNLKIPGNKIIITGRSTLQTFTIRYYFKEQLKQVYTKNVNSYLPKRTELQIPVRKLLFSNGHMKKDFLRLVHADEYPEIKIFYIPEIFKRQFSKQQQRIIQITIQITDVQKTYQVPVLFIRNNRPYTEMKGEVRIRLSDFNLKPKKYILGLIRIKETLKIDFMLYF